MFTLWTQEGLNVESGRWGWPLGVIDFYSKVTIEVKNWSCDNLVNNFVIYFLVFSSSLELFPLLWHLFHLFYHIKKISLNKKTL